MWRRIKFKVWYYFFICFTRLPVLNDRAGTLPSAPCSWKALRKCITLTRALHHPQILTSQGCKILLSHVEPRQDCLPSRLQMWKNIVPVSFLSQREMRHQLCCFSKLENDKQNRVPNTEQRWTQNLEDLVIQRQNDARPGSKINVFFTPANGGKKTYQS